jgi:hypothetical protein
MVILITLGFVLRNVLCIPRSLVTHGYTDVSKRALRWYSKCHCVAGVQDVERWMVCKPLSVNVFVTLATE